MVRHPGGVNVVVKHVIAVSSDKVGEIVVLFIVPMVEVLQVFATHGRQEFRIVGTKSRLTGFDFTNVG